MTSAEDLYVQRYRQKRAQPTSNANANANTNTNDDDFTDDGRHDQNGNENNKDNLSNKPTPRPSVTPSSLPSSNPSTLPTALPSVNPTKAPSSAPSVMPTNMPSSVPSLRPSGTPTGAPTSMPSIVPSTSPSNAPTERNKFTKSKPSFKGRRIVKQLSNQTIQKNLIRHRVSYTLRIKTSINYSTNHSKHTTMSFQQSSSPGSNNHRRKCCSSRTNKLSLIAVVLSFICLLSMTLAEDLYVQRYRHKRAQSASASANVNTNTNTNDDDFTDDGRHDQTGSENNKDNLSNKPTPRPSVTPSSLPSSNPSTLPTALPSVNPTKAPSSAPSVMPTNMPSSVPSLRPSGTPTGAPTSMPSIVPSTSPSNAPTVVPTSLPSYVPSLNPTLLPSFAPSSNPTRSPSVTPTLTPSRRPSTSPTSMPSLQPSDAPSGLPTAVPTGLPSLYPSKSPSEIPTVPPSTVPTLLPSGNPSIDCELGSAYGDDRGTPLELVFQYEITFDSTKPASEYIERVILPYLREVFAESLPSGLPTAIPTGLPSLYPSKSPSEIPTVPPSAAPTLLPSGNPSIDCELGSAYGDDRGTPLELVFQYEITFDGTNPASEYIERVILPYLREVFAESFLTSVSSITPYCGDECLLRRSRLRAENLPMTRRLQDVLAEADRKRTATGNKRVHQTVTDNTFLEANNNNSTLNEVEGDQLNADSNTNDGFYGSVINTIGNNDQVVNGLIGIALDSTNDEIDFFQNCTTTNSASCVRIDGKLVVYLDTPPDNVNLVENQLKQRLRQAMNNNLYVCSDPLLDIETVSYVEPDDTILAIQQTDDAIELTPTASSNFVMYSFIGGGVALGLLGMLLLFVRKKQTSGAFIDDIEDPSVYGDATPSAISEDSAWLTPV
eukprot:CAMPEP_0194399646 /NCGR_PEP_ID=MMETSP0174-20130528/126773_1 /TAXON_ID=216777 /ORGANISM="Proboscia alata, Strain PI-D3" /LENGTH=886 /DNA_ID=CAMNT_0039196073 /DNA_START=282 /DNA_END=2943 /DNA_ORIENTATION=-